MGIQFFSPRYKPNIDGDIIRFSRLRTSHSPLNICAFPLLSKASLHNSHPLSQHNDILRQSSFGGVSQYCRDGDGGSIFGQIVVTQYVEGLQELVHSVQQSFMERSAQSFAAAQAYSGYGGELLGECSRMDACVISRSIFFAAGLWRSK